MNIIGPLEKEFAANLKTTLKPIIKDTVKPAKHASVAAVHHPVRLNKTN